MKQLFKFKWFSFGILLVFSPLVLGQSISSQLTDLEQLTHKNAQQGYLELMKLTDSIQTSNRQTKLRWILLVLTAAYDHSNYQGVQDLIDLSPKLLPSKLNSDQTWLALLAVNQLFLQGKFADALPVLQAFEDKITNINEPLLTAFFHNMLFFSYAVNGMADFALDLAIINRKEWIQLEQYYYALEVLYRIANIRLNLSDFSGANRAVDLAQKEAEALKASNMHIGIIELKSSILLAQEQHESAYNILNALLESNTITPQHDKYQSVISSLAHASFQTEKYQRAIDLAEESLNLPIQITPALSAQLTVLAAKAHNKLGNHALAEKLINQSKESFKEQNNQFGLFETEQLLVDIYYSQNNIEKLYQTTSTLIDRVINYDDNQGKRRVERSAKIAYANEQEKVVEALAQDNIEKAEALMSSNQLLSVKNYYLRILAVFCVLLISLIFWTYYLLKKNHRLASRDPLTGIHNRRSGLEKAEKLAKKALAKNEVIGISIIDLDHFKKINDTFGHDVGDSVLKETVAAVETVLTNEAVFCRMGGEEFLVASASNNQKTIIALIDNILKAINNIPKSKLRTDKPISASAGLRIVTSQESTPLKTQIIDADFALYHAKEHGRNRLSNFSPEMAF